VLADSTYPLILKWIGAVREGGNVLQTTRIDLPYLIVPVNGVAAGEGVLLVGREGLGPAQGAVAAAGAGAPDAAALERELSASCRVELPGIYFAFNSAHLAPASDHAIAAIAGILARHPDWTATLEGHTDSIGSAAANKALSERRVAAVRARLVERHEVPRRACAWLDMAPRGRGSRTARSKGGHAIGEWSWCATVPGSGELP
jgi:outer membrane protein OmpA-like peptidoglycan-associated protein